MIEHVVIIKVKKNVLTQDMKIIIEAIKGLSKKIPSIISLSAGLNTSLRGHGFQIGVILRIETSKDLDDYLVHEAHVKLVNEILKPVMIDILVMDYEI